MYEPGFWVIEYGVAVVASVSDIDCLYAVCGVSVVEFGIIGFERCYLQSVFVRCVFGYGFEQSDELGEVFDSLVEAHLRGGLCV